MVFAASLPFADLTSTQQNYEHLFKANSPPTAPPKPPPGQKAVPPTAHSHYVQSKVVRARERIEAELKIAEEEPPTPPPAGGPGAAGTSASAAGQTAAGTGAGNGAS